MPLLSSPSNTLPTQKVLNFRSFTLNPAMATHLPSPQEIRHRVNHFLTKLSDRDTEALAVAELSAIARSLNADSLVPFISAVGDARPTDKTPLRRHSLRLLSLLARSHPSSSLSPHLPRLLGAALRRLRDPDSSVRAALVDAVSSLAAITPSAAIASTLLRPLTDALFHEQDIHPQSVSALSLSAALEELNGEDSEDFSLFLQRLVPRLVKLARSPAFKAKPAVLELLGSLAISDIGDAELKALVICLVEFLGSKDWASRNASAMALTRIAAMEKDRLGGFKQSCLATFESRRYDKVKIVRDSMNRMLEAWKEIPEDDLDLPKPLAESQSSSYLKEIDDDRRYPVTSINSSLSVQSSFPFTSKKIRIPNCRSPQNAVTPIVTAKNIQIDQRKISRMNKQKKKSDWRVEIAVPDAPLCNAESENSVTSKGRGAKTCQQEISEDNGRSRLEVRRALFEKNWEDKKIGGLKSGSRIVPFEEKNGNSEVMNEATVATDKLHGEQKDGDLSLIRMQLVQIENQQSSLLNLLQRFIGNSQKGIHSLEARVLNLELALDNMSRDIASASSGRLMNNDRVARMCCRLPGTEFFSSKFWRRADGRYASRFLLTYKQENQKFGLSGGFVNPLAEANHQMLGNTSRYNGTMVV